MFCLRKQDFILIICLLYQNNLIKGLKPESFCYLKNNELKLKKCATYQCTFDTCSINKQKCNTLTEWNELIEKYNKFDSIKNLKEIYQDFIEDIKECIDFKYVSLESKVCFKKEKCSKKQWPRINRLNNKVFFYAKNCECTGKLKFNCGKDFCSLNKNICDIFNTIPVIDHFKIINKC